MARDDLKPRWFNEDAYARYTLAVPSSAKPKSGYLPGLDGLRSFAILGVLMTHDLPWSIAGHSNAKWKGYGGWGVDLFFAISGVLICWRLLEDEARSGHIRLRDFYIRRLFRIQPAAFTYLAVIAILCLLSVIPTGWPIWWSAVLSYANFLVTAKSPPGIPNFVGHFWTLSVEEHFYILISVFFLIARRYRAALLGSLLVVLVLAQTYIQHLGLYTTIVSERRSYWVLQFLFFPALLALLVRPARTRTLVERYGKPWVVTVLLAVLMLLNLLQYGTQLLFREVRHFSPVFFFSYNMNVLFYGFGGWVIAIMLSPTSWTTRFLELRPLRFIGRLSYSIYLWHILFFMPVYLPEMVRPKSLLVLAERPWKYLLTAVAALVSYYCIEKPMIRLGHKIAPPATAGHRDLEVQPEPAQGVSPATPALAETSR